MSLETGLYFTMVIGMAVSHLSLFIWTAKCVNIFDVLLPLPLSTILSTGVMSVQHSAPNGMCTNVSITNLIHLLKIF